MELLDGKALSIRLNKALAAEVRGMARPPGLAVILVGADPASQVYVRSKGRVAGRIGFHHEQHDLPADTSQQALHDLIDRLNEDPRVDGILVQLPLPRHLDASAALDRIDPAKDADGIAVHSVGLLAQGRPGFVPCTPLGVMKLLEESGIDLSGKRAAVVGRSNIVGRPMAMVLEQANCTVTVCHSRTRDLQGIIAQSDVVVAAIGRANAIQASWMPAGAVAIDVGINRLDDGSLAGDIDLTGGEHLADATPVPGGVGPMTIAMLMHNTARAARARGA